MPYTFNPLGKKIKKAPSFWLLLKKKEKKGTDLFIDTVRKYFVI